VPQQQQNLVFVCLKTAYFGSFRELVVYNVHCRLRGEILTGL